MTATAITQAAMTRTASPARIGETARFEQKREAILDAASGLINQHGVKGMTLSEVARRVDLNTTGVTYYFKRKDLLAGACFHRALERIEAMVACAEAQATPRARVGVFLGLHFDLRARIRRGEDRPLTLLADLRAMDDPVRGALMSRYGAMFQRVRGFFDPEGSESAASRATARAQVLMENVFWLPAWLQLYSVQDFDRVRLRLMELFEHGLAPQGAAWAPARLALRAQPEAVGERRNFLVVATRLINERGYRGASVERIVAELKVTKGSFYYHLEAKDDLVLDCFRRSYGAVSLTQRLADEMGGDHWTRLTSAIATLLDLQFSSRGPLLRTTALQALPSELRSQVLERSNRMARRFAGSLIDGISEGSIRAIDPLVASQAIMAMLNAAYELRSWAASLAPDQAIADYASTLAYGLFDDAGRV